MHKRFIAGPGNKVSSAAFIAAHREFLETGSLAPLTAPVLAALDEGKVPPTPALGLLQQMVLDSLLMQTVQAAAVKIAAANAPMVKKTTLPFTVTILGKDGQPVMVDGEALSSNQESQFKANGWASRRLAEGSPEWTARVVDNRNGLSEVINRDQAMVTVFRPRAGAGPVVKRPNPNGRLNQHMRLREDTPRFSKG